VSTAAERRGHLYDLQCLGAAYEAAALFYVATTTKQTARNSHGAKNAVATRGKKSKAQQKNTGSMSVAHDRALDEEEEEAGQDVDNTDDLQDSQAKQQQQQQQRSLQLSDLVDASAAFTYLQVKEVLPRVQELAGLIQKEKTKEQRQNTNNANSNSADPSNKPLRRKTKKRPWQNSETTAVPFEGLVDSSHRLQDATNNDSSTMMAQDTPSTPSFLDWKEEILAQVQDQAQQQNDSNAASTNAMEWAADQVLQKYGLLDV